MDAPQGKLRSLTETTPSLADTTSTTHTLDGGGGGKGCGTEKWGKKIWKTIKEGRGY